MCHFLSSCFKDFFLSSIFISLIMIYLGMSFLGFILSSWICKFMFFAKLENFSVLFIKCILLRCIFFFSSSSDLQWQILDLSVLSHSSLRCCSFFFPPCVFYFVQIEWFLLLSSNSLTLSCVISILWLKPFSGFSFILLTVV